MVVFPKFFLLEKYTLPQNLISMNFLLISISLSMLYFNASALETFGYASKKTGDTYKIYVSLPSNYSTSKKK